MSYDFDPPETTEWLEALDSVVQVHGIERAKFILETLLLAANGHGVGVATLNTPYKNTLPNDVTYPGDSALEAKILAALRWNAAAMVVKANKTDGDLGGHIGTYASIANLYEVGFNHFWRGNKDGHGDLVFFQGHSSPGIYARSFLEGRFSQEQLVNFRQETQGKGLSSYPHPWLMPNYWQFPTVSMGLGPLQAVYQARFIRYMVARNLLPASHLERKVWCFCGDGEMDEPESLGAVGLASREHLDNLIFVVNCNLQRLDGPVRGNGKIIQELERIFKGYGWHVIKVIWGSQWDSLLSQDKSGKLLARLNATVDGDYQNYVTKGGKYIREHLFGDDQDLTQLVAHLSDAELEQMGRGGHDNSKIYSAYSAACSYQGKPVVILAKSVKGYGLGLAGEGLNTAHNTKKMELNHLLALRDRFHLPLSDIEVEQLKFLTFKANSPEQKYLLQQREKLAGFVPSRRVKSDEQLIIPALNIFQGQLEGSEREISTTMAFVRMLGALCKDANIGSRIVPIVPDEARTFGMEGLFRQLGIYAPQGQLYRPVDIEQVMYYKEAQDGQILQEGLNEAGAISAWLAAATAYSNHNKTLIPFYIYYSMFGFQRVGDLAWAAGDLRAKGFLIGATSGRTTLNGEGLQHEDGHSHIVANTIPNCISYDPTFMHELAVIIQDGLERMYSKGEDIFYYLTVMNENYTHPSYHAADKDGIIKGIYLLSPREKKEKLFVNILGCGTILREALQAEELLKEFGVEANVFSATSFNLLTRDVNDTLRHNLLTDNNKTPYITEVLAPHQAPTVAATDYMRQYAEGIRPGILGQYIVLGTDGFGRSDSRKALRQHFEVDRYYIAWASLKALYNEQKVPAKLLKAARAKWAIDGNKTNPLYS